MLTTPDRSITLQRRNRSVLATHLRTIVLWPFTSRFASPVWLAVRLYLGYVWFTMGFSKLSSGFLTGDPTGDMLRLAGDGIMPVPVEGYRPVARWLVDLGVTPLLSHSIPFLEMAVALAFIGGVLVVPAALGATFLNANFLLSGVAITQLDLRCIGLQLLLILACRSVGYLSYKCVSRRFGEHFRYLRFKSFPTVRIQARTHIGPLACRSESGVALALPPASQLGSVKRVDSVKSQ